VQLRPHPGTPGPAVDPDLLGGVDGGGQAAAARAERAGPGEYRQAGACVTDLNGEDGVLQQQGDLDGRAAVRPGVGAELGMPFVQEGRGQAIDVMTERDDAGGCGRDR
jgi:hypothetical protein